MNEAVSSLVSAFKAQHESHNGDGRSPMCDAEDAPSGLCGQLY
jgi:hypothetical protein